jgi:O-antigen ligase
MYLVIFPFGQLGRIEFIPNVPIHLIDIVAGLITLVTTPAFLKGTFKFPPFSRFYIYFLLILLFSLLVNFNTVSLPEFAFGASYFFRIVTYINFYFVIWNLFEKKHLSNKAQSWLEVVGITIVFLGFLQYIFMPDLGILSIYGWDPHIYRLTGSFLDTGFAGILIVFFILLNFSREKYSWQTWILSGFGILALALTYSRASYLAYIAGLLAIYIVRRNIKLLIGGIVLLLVLIPLLPKPSGEGVNLARTSTINFRFESYKHALEVAGQNPLFGVGYNLYRYTQDNQRSHGASGTDSSLLLVFATSGIVGLLLFLQISWKIFMTAWLKRGSTLGLCLFASLIALGIHSLFDNSLFYPWVMGWIFLLFASVSTVRKSS